LEFARERIDIVIGSCGCYGIPLLEYCFRRHNMAAIYYGNYTNMAFGVRLADFEGHFDQANLEEWVDPFVGWEEGVPANMERIDGGRYLPIQLPFAAGDQPANDS
jgi:hypothetical protein